MSHHPYIDYTGVEVPPASPGEFLLTDEPQHARYRKPLAGKFTARRMRLLTERLEQITAEHLDAMEQAGPPTDLVTAFAKPIPAIMICELLGVPYADRGSFQDNITTLVGGEASDEVLIAAYTPPSSTSRSWWPPSARTPPTTCSATTPAATTPAAI